MAVKQKFDAGGFEIDIVVQGYPGKSVCHGGLGWSTVALIRSPEWLALIDGGNFGMRRMLIERLRERGLKNTDVTDMLLTHSHYDHSVNWTLFKQARIIIGAQELDWSLTVPWGETPVAELYMKELKTWPTLKTAHDGEEVVKGITAHAAPGHTPGHLIFVLHGNDRDVVFTGDAAKNRAEMITRNVDLTLDAAASAESIELIWKLWSARPGSILVPGHDLPMVLEDGKPRYLGEREAAIRAWFDDDLERTTLFRLTVDD
jgi:glyoxylase-like metal-dependent hydrolase (beta-lactamase superfamily II)